MKELPERDFLDERGLVGAVIRGGAEARGAERTAPHAPTQAVRPHYLLSLSRAIGLK